MRCPDCGASLSNVPLAGRVGQAMRCGRCGGWWTDGGIVNETTTAELIKWPGKMISGKWLSMGEERCPRDNQVLVKYAGENVPLEVTVKRCNLCGWWWWAGDELYKFKPAQEAKMVYYKMWGNVGEPGSILLPLVTLIILLTGLIIGLLATQVKQQVGVPAYQQRSR